MIVVDVGSGHGSSAALPSCTSDSSKGTLGALCQAVAASNPKPTREGVGALIRLLTMGISANGFLMQSNKGEEVEILAMPYRKLRSKMTDQIETETETPHNQ